VPKQNLRYWFKATPTLERRIGSICNTHGCQRNLRWSWNEAYITIRWDTASWCAKTAVKSVTQLFLPAVIDYDYKRSDTSLYSTKCWSRKGSLRQFRWFALTYFFGLYFKYFINLKTVESVVALTRCPPATRLVATVFWLRATDQRRSSWMSEVHVHTDSVIQIN